MRFQQGTFTLTTTYWWLDVSSDLKFVGDSNSVEPSAPTKRRGYEVATFWRPDSVARHRWCVDRQPCAHRGSGGSRTS